MTSLRLRYVHAFVDRHGKARYYFRRHGRRVPLPDLPGSAAFNRAYEAALAGSPPAVEVGATRTIAGLARLHSGNSRPLRNGNIGAS